MVFGLLGSLQFAGKQWPPVPRDEKSLMLAQQNSDHRCWDVYSDFNPRPGMMQGSILLSPPS